MMKLVNVKKLEVAVAMVAVAMELVMVPINIQQFQNHRDLEMDLIIEMVLFIIQLMVSPHIKA